MINKLFRRNNKHYDIKRNLKNLKESYKLKEGNTFPSDISATLVFNKDFESSIKNEQLSLFLKDKKVVIYYPLPLQKTTNINVHEFVKDIKKNYDSDIVLGLSHAPPLLLYNYFNNSKHDDSLILISDYNFDIMKKLSLNYNQTLVINNNTIIYNSAHLFRKIIFSICIISVSIYLAVEYWYIYNECMNTAIPDIKE